MSSRAYSWNGRWVSAAEYADLISDLIARGHCVHAEGCEHIIPTGANALPEGVDQ